MDLPATAKRVPEHTTEDVNRCIREMTSCRIRYYSEHPDEIDRRLRELDEEWDIERTLEANASAFALSGLVLGLTVEKKFLLLTGAVLAFLGQHALQGWCPPLPVFRRMGVRTETEIETEKSALRMLRGDFEGVTGGDGKADVNQVLNKLGLG